MANEPIQGLPYPELTGVPPNVPEHIKALADAVAPRTVMRFASLAARDAALPSPVDGMVCYVAADNTYYCRSGGSWRVLWRLVTSPQIQYGNATVTLSSLANNSQASQAVAFPVPFAGSPRVFCQVAANSSSIIHNVSAQTSTGFTINVKNISGGALSSSVSVNWLATL